MNAHSATPASRTKTNLFDLRWILTLLFGVYGVVVTIMGIVAHNPTYSASGNNIQININLWTGIAMLVLAVLFALWARLRPLRIPQEEKPVAEAEAE